MCFDLPEVRLQACLPAMGPDFFAHMRVSLCTASPYFSFFRTGWSFQGD
jgi:hypothetical protein